MALGLLAAPDASQASANAQAIVVDGARLQTSALNQDGRLLVPAALFRKMGVDVAWDAKAQAAVLIRAGIRLSAGASQGAVHKPNATYVPLRAAAEALGLRVAYDPASGTASIDTGAASVTMAASGSSGNASNAGASGAVADEDRLWLEKITEAEAGGEPYDGKVAVAAAVLNRTVSPDWPDTIQGVIFQIVDVGGIAYYQFSPVLDGRIYDVEPSEETKKAVQAALDGEDPTGGAVVFYNPKKTNNAWVRERPVSTTIGGHVFAY